MGRSSDLPPPPPYEAEGVYERAPLLAPPSYIQNEYELRERRRRRSCSWRTILLAALTTFSIFTLGFSVIYCAETQVSLPPETEVPVRIAVIGGGPSGISTAFTLSSLLALSKIPAEITVFERKPHIGGRLFLSNPLLGKGNGVSNVQGRIHPQDVANGDLMLGNPQVAGRAKEILNYTQAEGEGQVVRVGFWDGEGFRSESVRPVEKLSWGLWIKLVRKYGLSVLRAKALPVGTMERWKRMIRLGSGVGKEFGFEGLEEWVRKGKMKGAVALSAKERLGINGIGKGYVDDVVEAVVRRQWGQGIEELSDLALSAGLEREIGFMGGEGWRLEEVFEGILKKSYALLSVESEVLGLKKEVGKGGKKEWGLEVRSTSDEKGNSTYETFDKVVLAGPWNTSRFLRAEEREDQEQVTYRGQWINFITSTGKLNGTYFGASSSSDLPDQILPIPSADLSQELKGITSLSYLKPLFIPDLLRTETIHHLYRITSSHSLSKEAISTFFENGIQEMISEEIKHAYPLLYPRSEGFGKFKVQEGLWHTGVGEAVGSGVDWSWLLGEHVSLLVWRDIKGERGGKR